MFLSQNDEESLNAFIVVGNGVGITGLISQGIFLIPHTKDTVSFVDGYTASGGYFLGMISLDKL